MIALAYAVFIVVIYTLILSDAYGQHRRWRDRRSWGELLDAVVLWMVAISSAGSVGAYFIFNGRSTVGAALAFLAAGAFAYFGARYYIHRRQSREG